MRERSLTLLFYQPWRQAAGVLRGNPLRAGLGALAMPARGSRAGLRAAEQKAVPEEDASKAPEPPPVAAYRKWVDVKKRRRRKVR